MLSFDYIILSEKTITQSVGHFQIFKKTDDK